jgi:hypothetical protein
MLQDVYDALRSRRLDPRWVEEEVHVEVRGRAFAVAGHPHGVTIRKRHVASPAESVVDVCTDTDQLLSALGLGSRGKPPARDADCETRPGPDRHAELGSATTVASLRQVGNPTPTLEPGTTHPPERDTIFRQVYERLLFHRIVPRWVDDELYVNVHGRAFALLERPRGVAVRMQGTTAATVCEELGEALAALGFRRQGETSGKP